MADPVIKVIILYLHPESAQRYNTFVQQNAGRGTSMNADEPDSNGVKAQQYTTGSVPTNVHVRNITNS